MTLLKAESQSRFLIETRPAGTDQPGQGRSRCFWKAFLMALMRTLSAWAV